MKAEIVIIDGKNLLHRVAHVHSKQQRQFKNIFVQAFLHSCLKIYNLLGGKFIFAWEGSGNFRFDVYPQYKAKQTPSPELKEMLESMEKQERKLKHLLSTLGFEQYLGNGGEGDDVIGYLSRKFSARGKTVVIYSADSDLRQLVSDFVYTMSPSPEGEVVFNVEAVEKKHGVKPERIPDLKALTGDKSDCIPGVGGIGPKKAIALIQKLGDIESIIAAAQDESMTWAESVNSSLRKWIAVSSIEIRRNLILVTIVSDASLVKEIPPELNEENSLAFMEDLGIEFPSMILRKLLKMAKG